MINPWIIKQWYSQSLKKTQIDEILNYEYNFHHSRWLEELEMKRISLELNSLEKYILHRRKVAAMYDDYFSQEKNFKTFRPPENYKGSYFKYPVIFRREKTRFKVWKALIRAGFKIDYWYQPLHESPLWSMFNDGGNYSNSEYLASKLLPLPVTENFRQETIEKIISILQKLTS